jgi:hypothetical protein
MLTKQFKTIAIFIVLTVFLFSNSSCVVYHKKNNGKHKGWYKNPKNPHNPHSTNPGRGNGKNKK